MIEPIKLRRGPGNGDPKDGLCLLQAVHWFSGADNLSDHPVCVSPVLREIGTRINDLAPDQASRDSLWPLVWQLLDSRDPENEQHRAEYIVREVAHRIIAPVFERAGLSKEATALRASQSMPEIEKAAWAAVRAAAAARAATLAEAARAAEAAARAAAWAEAAKAATWAAEAAARTRAAAAEAARAAAARAAAKAAAWDELRLIFIEAIALGKHGEADPIYESRAVDLRRILEGAGA